MTPFGKSVAEVTEADLQRLIDEGWPEGRYVEFKEGVPISKEEQKRLRSSEGGQTTDRSPMYVGTLQPFGRDELLAELVAFANADGGVLILGLAETDDAPARAKAFNPLAAVAGLERKLRDVVIDCIEPRLPYAVVKAVQTQPDGAGILLLEIEPSRLGPHRVRTTLKAMIRREDSCVPMSMVEIHDMVLRNARRFDSLTEALSDRSTRFRKEFIDTLFSHKPPDPSGMPYTRDQSISWWFDQDSLAGIGFRVTVIPHDNLGIPRLERLDGLVPPDDFVQQDNAAGRVPLPGASVVWAAKHGGHRILGGVHQTDGQDGVVKAHVVKRDGFVDGTVVSWG
jgi:hypothetical protein